MPNLPTRWKRRLARTREVFWASLAIGRLVALILFELMKPPTPEARAVRRRMRRTQHA